MRAGPSFTTRLTGALALLLLAFAALVALLARQVASEHEAESLQRLSHGLARHIVGQWPQITAADPSPADQAARAALLRMLTGVNPGIQVYVLAADGHVNAYIGEPGMVRQHQVDLQPVRDFLAGGALPLRGTDPMGGADGARARIFSAAMLAPQPGQTTPPGYLYIVLDGPLRAQVAGQVSLRRVWQGAAIVAGAGLLLTLLLGVLAFGRLTRPLHQLAGRMRDFSLRHPHLRADPADPAAATAADRPPLAGDEVAVIAQAYGDMTRRVERQAETEQRSANAHREMMASVAHDLRTPLTALHGHLEALAAQAGQAAAGPPGSTAPGSAAPGTTLPGTTLPDTTLPDTITQPGSARLLQAALAQSNKVRRLSQQLFELAALQSDHQVLHRERFNLDELVTDAVQKFALGPQQPTVTLAGAPPGPLALDGDLQLIERALSNLIDNALRHAPGSSPVRVSLRRHGASAQILVEDAGPGLPPAWLDRLARQHSLRDPPLRRASGGGAGVGGIGGLGLAIAQRVALLHGGSLLPLPAPQGGTRLCLALPLAP